ncbi:MAG: DUF2695 domain-containing protein [Specibacter sp.]
MEGISPGSSGAPCGDGMATGVEAELRDLSEAMTRPWPHECVACYVYRMLEFGCDGHRWVSRYRALSAPRATALERRLAARGGYCDCELFMNVFFASPRFFTTDEDGDVVPQPMPACRGVRGGSSKECELWEGRESYGWSYPF